MAKSNKKETFKTAKNATVTGAVTGKTGGSFGTINQASRQQTNNNQTALQNTSPITHDTKYGSTYDALQATAIDPYTESQTVQDAKAHLNAYLNGEGKPAYTSQYSDTIRDMANKIANREDFSYDFNTDPLYQNYRDQYQRQAVLGQQGAMANAAALTGGYGSSYASTAGNLAYQENMSQLNNVIPQLYQMAYDKYNTDLSNQRADLSMYQDLENTDYGRYRDQVSDWNTDRGYYTDYYNTEADRDWNKYRANVDDIHWKDSFNQTENSNAQNYNSQEHWNKKNYDQGVKEWKEQIRQYNKSLKEEQRQFDKNYKLAKKVKTSGGSGGGGYRRSGSSSKGSSGIPTAVYNILKKYRNGNKPQGEIAANVLNRLASQYNLSDSQMDYLYGTWLGYKSTPTVKENTKHDTGKKTKYQTYLDIPEVVRDSFDIMNDEQFASYKMQNKGGGDWKNYEAYLKAMAKKYGF